MWDFGTSQNHANRVDYSDIAALDGLTTQSIAAWVELNTLLTADNQRVFGKHNGTTGWGFFLSSTELMRLFDDSTERGISTTALSVDSTPHSFVANIASGSGDLYVDNVDEANIVSWGPPSTTHLVSLGDITANTLGAPVKLGHPMGWDSDIGSGGVSDYHNNTLEFPPDLANLQFWVKCINSAPQDAEVPVADSGTKTGTVNEHVDSTIDNFYIPSPGGFAYLVSLHWATLLGASALFGSALRLESANKLLKAIRKEMKCQFFGSEDDHRLLIEAAEFSKRPSYSFLF
jgi:hypothetical protein